MATPRKPDVARRFNPLLAGAIGGLCAVVSWGASFALAKQGTLQGLSAVDFVLLRFGVAGVLSIPLLLVRWHAVKAIGFVGGCALTGVAGPLFVLIGFSGFAYAPLAHGAVIQPSTVAIGGIVLATLLFGEILTTRKIAGAVAIVCGIVLVGSSGLATGNTSAWKGDLLFAAAGGLWLGFTVLVRRWRVDPVAGTAIVNTLAGAIILPVFVLMADSSRLLALHVGQLAIQALVQGALAGVLATVGFAFAVGQLGISRAALFPAMVPAATVLIGFVFTAEIPTTYQVVGLCLATLGLAVALIPASTANTEILPGQ